MSPGISGMIVAMLALAAAPFPAAACGELVESLAHDGTPIRYSLAVPPEGAAATPPVTLVLLVGGGGHLDLGPDGCPRGLTSNSLVRMAPLLRRAGFTTALVDSPAGMTGPDGLGGFRTSPDHAGDLGRVIADLRRRLGGEVWVAGTSRGTISAVNVASRLGRPAGGDGLVLTSVLGAGDARARKPWVAQTVFDLALEAIAVPVLLIGHAEDNCIRSPPSLMNEVAARLRSPRIRVMTVTGGPGGFRPGRDVDACQAMSPHGFIGQEAEVVAEIRGFVGLGR